MPQITLRKKVGTSSPQDVTVIVRDNTFEYLMTSQAETIRVSAYLDRDWDQVDATFAELFIDALCPFQTLITRVTPGSKTRSGITLPAAMKKNEQLTVEVERGPRRNALPEVGR